MRNKLFSILLIINIILGIGIFTLPQENESQSEKRLLSTNEDIKFDYNLVRSSENVLKHQFYFRNRIVRYYYKGRIILNLFTEKVIDYPRKLIRKISGNDDNQNNGGVIDTSLKYLAEGVIELDDGYLINSILEYNDEEKYQASSRGYNLNEFASRYKDIKTYVYFPTRLEEILNNDYDNQCICQEQFIQQLNNDIKHRSLIIDDYEDHKKYYFHSDTHWNAYGAYEGYKDIIEMIGEDYSIGEIKPIENVIEYEYEFYGNIANKIDGYGIKDRIIDLELTGINDFDYYIDGEKADYYAVKKDYELNGNNTVYSDYDYYFGDNNFLRQFDFHDNNKPNILIFGDSYNNTNMLWIASHFNKTTIIDLRRKPENFNLNNFVNQNDIDIFLVNYYYFNAFINGNLYIPID